MPLGERHRGVEADDRERRATSQDRLDDGLADLGLAGSRAAPCRSTASWCRRCRGRRSASSPVPRSPALEHDRGVGVVEVVVLDLDADAPVVRQVGPAERVGRVRRRRARDMNQSGCSITQRESMPMWLGTMSRASRMPRDQARAFRLLERVLAAEVVGDPVVVQRVGRGDRLGVAAQLLDRLRRAAALPQPDQPEAGEARAGRAGRAPRRGSRRGGRCGGRTASRAGRARRSVLLAISTSRGIQSRSTLKRSTSVSPPRDQPDSVSHARDRRAAPRPRRRRRPLPGWNRRQTAALLLREDVEAG